MQTRNSEDICLWLYKSSSLLQCWGCLMVGLAVSRWLLVRASCHVPLFGPVTSRTSSPFPSTPVLVFGLLIVVPPLIFGQVLVSVFILCIHITPMVLSSSFWHLFCLLNKLKERLRERNESNSREQCEAVWKNYLQMLENQPRKKCTLWTTTFKHKKQPLK